MHRPCWAQLPVPRKGSPVWNWHQEIHLNHRFSLSDLRRWCKCRKDLVDEQQWRILAILGSLKMVTDESRGHTPPWPRRKPTGFPRPTLYTQIMLDIAITSKGSNGESRPRAQVTAVIVRPPCPFLFIPASGYWQEQRELTVSRRICFLCLPLGRSRTRYSSSVVPTAIDPA